MLLPSYFEIFYLLTGVFILSNSSFASLHICLLPPLKSTRFAFAHLIFIFPSIYFSFHTFAPYLSPDHFFPSNSLLSLFLSPQLCFLSPSVYPFSLTWSFLSFKFLAFSITHHIFASSPLLCILFLASSPFFPSDSLL